MIKELAKMLRDKKISTDELFLHYADKIREKNPESNCFITLCDKQSVSFEEKNLLSGIPYAVKDNICTKGIKTTCASEMLKDFVPSYSATAVDRLNFCPILGKTNMDEFGMGSRSDTGVFGAVVNPENPDKSVGGSSGGSALSVALGLAPFALGSDTGGSVRQPAACCGVTGLMPSYGRVSRFGLVAFASSLDRIGVLAQSSEDAGLVLEKIAGKDKLDMTASGGTFKLDTSYKMKRVGIIMDLLEISDKNTQDTVINAAKILEMNGATVSDVRIDCVSKAVSAYYLISSSEAMSNLARYDGIRYGMKSDGGYIHAVTKSRTDGFGSEVKRRILLGSYALSEGYFEEYYKKANEVRKRLTNSFLEAFEEFDILLAPTQTEELMIDEKTSEELYRSDLCTVLASLSGLPAVNVNFGAVSIIGAPMQENKILSAAVLLENTFGRGEAVL